MRPKRSGAQILDEFHSFLETSRIQRTREYLVTVLLKKPIAAFLGLSQGFLGEAGGFHAQYLLAYCQHNFPTPLLPSQDEQATNSIIANRMSFLI